MVIQGVRGTYKVEPRVYGRTYSEVVLYEEATRWWGKRYWKEIQVMESDRKFAEWSAMYPGEMMALFIPIVAEYEKYLAKWEAYEALIASGGKLEVKTPK